MDDDFELIKYPKTQPVFFGYSMTIGSDGSPVVKQYGTPIPGLITSDVREPFVDEVIDKNSNTLKLIAEMPGVDKKDINVTIEPKYAKISAERGERKYDVKVPLKHKIDENSAKATYANGVLEIALRLVEERPKGKTVAIS
jgi:HSP20 family protein